MAEVLEQINKMTREEKIRLAHILLDAIEHGTVIKPSVPKRKLEPDAMLMAASITDADLFDDCSGDFEELNHA